MVYSSVSALTCVVQVSMGKVGQLLQAGEAVFGGHRWGSKDRWSCGGGISGRLI